MKTYLFGGKYLPITRLNSDNILCQSINRAMILRGIGNYIQLHNSKNKDILAKLTSKCETFLLRAYLDLSGTWRASHTFSKPL